MTVTATIDTDYAAGIIHVRLAGHLDLAGAATVRRVLRKAVAQAPVAILVNLAELIVSQRRHLAVFTAVPHRAEAELPVLLHSAAPDVARLVRHLAGRSVPLYGTPVEALTAAVRVTGRGRRTAGVQLMPTDDAPARARRMVGDACARWGIATARERALVIVSELVTNSVQHAGTRITVSAVLRRPYLHLQVQDANPVEPRPRGAGDASARTGGHGLHLVDAFATAWGCVIAGAGKTVWATIRVVPAGEPLR